MIKLSMSAVAMAAFLMYYLDGRIPEPIPEQWKVKIMDAWMKTYGYTINALVRIGITEPLSELDRKISDIFMLVMITGTPWGLGYDPRLQITDTKLKGIRVKIYQPVSLLNEKNRPVLVYFHGGGWSLLSVDSYDPLMRRLCKDSGVVIISVNYRLSPQHPYPEPLHDCLDVVEYVIDNADSLGVDSSRIGIAGDSAGGNMAAAISLRLKRKLALQMLLVPVLQMTNWNTTGAIENSLYLNKSINDPNALHFVLNYLGVPHKYINDFWTNNHTSAAFKVSHYADYMDQNTWLPKRYIRDENLKNNIHLQTGFGNEELFAQIESKLTDPMVSPLLADDEMLEGLPATYIMTCGYDFMRDDGIMYYERLHQLGEDASLSHFPDAFHNALFFPHGPLKINVAIKIVNDIVRVIKSKLIK